MAGDVYSGTIVIDENEAQDDMKRLEIAKNHLTEAMTYLSQINLQAEEFAGNTGNTIREKTTELQSNIKVLLERVASAEESIVRTVKEFKTVDESIGNAISSMN